MIPDFGGLIWMVIAILEAVAGIALFMLFVFWIMPPISRLLVRAKFSKRSVAFIQHAGKVHLCLTKTELPEGVIENKFGWFLKSGVPYKGTQSKQKRGPGRPRKDEKDEVVEGASMDDIEKALDIALETPILEGLNKHVLFGSSDTALLGNLNTLTLMSKNPDSGENKESLGRFLGQAVLNALKAVIPATMSRTQLDAIATLNYLKGLKVGGKDVIKLIIIVIAVIGVMGSLGIILWFLTQH